MDYQVTDKNDIPTVAEALRTWRLDEGWTQAEMAAKLDMPQGNYSLVEAGKRALPINGMRWAYILGIPTEILMQPFEEKSNG